MTMPGTPPQPTTAPNTSITQGPQWLIDLYASPPPWINPALKITAVVTLLIVAYRLYQWDGDIPLDVQREMLVVVAHITSITTATLAAVNWLHVPYLVDIVCGFAVGYGAVLALQRPAIARRLPGSAVGRERLMQAWASVSFAVVFLPIVAMRRGVGIALTKSRWLLAAIAIVMLVYNAKQHEKAEKSGSGDVQNN